MKNYVAFLAIQDRTSDLPETISIPAPDKLGARRNAAAWLRDCGYHVELSNTSEEVIATDTDGNEIVYYGFDEE